MKRKRDWLALAAKLERFSASAERTQAPRGDRETVAADYPEAWPELQRRRCSLKWSSHCMIIGIIATVALVLIARFLPGRLGLLAGDAAGIAWLVALVPGPVLNYSATMFRCPRCGEYFMMPGSRASDSLHKPRTTCQHCRLRIGEPHN